MTTKLAGEVYHWGEGREPDWYVTPGGADCWAWAVHDWTGERVAYGVRATRAEALVECVRWARA